MKLFIVVLLAGCFFDKYKCQNGYAAGAYANAGAMAGPGGASANAAAGAWARGRGVPTTAAPTAAPTAPPPLAARRPAGLPRPAPAPAKPLVRGPITPPRQPATTRAPVTRVPRAPAVTAAGINANAFCFECLMRVNNRDLFANPIDCHTYFQCLYLNETEATGILMRCAPGTFFDETRLTCQPEGEVPCAPSPCSNPAIAALGCYQLPGQSCRQYFTCEFNETRCCPMDTRFDPTTCGCIPDPTCTDFCQALPTATMAPTSNLTACTDAFGNTLLPVPGREDLFQLGDYFLSCAIGTTFDLTTCACSTPVNFTMSTHGGRQCQLWLPFDTDLMDKSTSMLTTFPYGYAMHDVSTAASGAGSLLVSGGRLEIPGLKSIELNNPLGVSWCFAFRCGTTAPFTCGTNGGILSNSRDATATIYTIIAAISGTNTLLADIRTENATATETATVNTPTAGWNDVCIVYANDTVDMYVNGALSATAPLVGPLAIAHCPYVVGNDQFYGDFIGNVDNVLVCNTPLSAAEIQAHYTGDFASLAAADLIPQA